MDDVDPLPGRFETGLVLGLYVIPLTLTVGFLAVVGLPGLALALLAVECVVAASVTLAKRPDGTLRRPGALVVGLLVVALAAAAGAVALLTPAG